MIGDFADKEPVQMRYCHELLFDDLDNIARQHLQDLIAFHAQTCARGDDAWDCEWGDDRVVILFQREADMLLSARTLNEQYDRLTDKFCILTELYRAHAIYTD